MKKYTALTKYLILLEGDAYGERDLGKQGTAHTPREERKTAQAGTVRYSAVVNALIEDAEAFFCAHEEARPRNTTSQGRATITSIPPRGKSIPRFSMPTACWRCSMGYSAPSATVPGPCLNCSVTAR